MYLPVEQYLLTPAQLAQLDYAIGLLTQDCMKRFQFSLDIPAELTHQRTGSQIPRRYGPSDLSEAQQYGYHSRPDEDRDLAKVPPPEDLPAAEQFVLTGNTNTAANSAPTLSGGLDIPPGGCRGAAVREIGGGAGSYAGSELAQQIGDTSFMRAKSDDRVTAVNSAWSACMKTHGYAYQTPMDAFSDSQWKGSQMASQLELSVATADVTCKQQTNLIGVWYSVESAFQQQQIQKHAEQLAQDQSRMQQELGRTADVLRTANKPGTTG
ncbi:hypothetical protein ACIHEI_08825 [Kitasatospora sp. NPDC051984]|uniref:hypothetical protein n=1 Tax=Kitasatospora sp. NPDC051984 TaxID=3364059 RepID=UPI0037CBF368